MLYTASLPLTHSWPIFEAADRMDLPRLMALCAGKADALAEDALEGAGIGVWTCNLADNALIWSPAVYRLFGFAPDEAPCRDLSVACYTDRSRLMMETLRTYAIRHRRGFTLDAMIHRPGGEQRWMRLSAMPVIANGKVVRLCGTKQDVTAAFDGRG